MSITGSACVGDVGSDPSLRRGVVRSELLAALGESLMFRILWHKLRSRHHVYWSGSRDRYALFDCDCGRRFSLWTPIKR